MKSTNYPDPYNLNRFIGAQESYYQTALQEIHNGCKDSHWIWFIFPQMKGLGYSPAAQNYGITSLNEARAYLANPTLRKHLIEVSEALLQHKDMTAFEILGTTDAIKVRSCMTLFDMVEPNSVFEQVLECFYMDERDELTLQILQSMKKPDGRKKIVFLTGAGVSKESGIATFRDPQDGLWAQYDPMKLCSNVGFKENPQLVLDFYNMRRQKIYDAQPNDAHRIIAELEKDYDVTVITQNVDNLHERAGSSRVIHVHGELTKVTSSDNRLDYNCIR